MFMKKLLFFVLALLFISCSKDDDAPDGRFVGDWFLTSVSCYCGLDPSRDLSSFTLRFEENANTVHIDSPDDELFYLAAPGRYRYATEGTTIQIAGTDPYRFEFKNSKLILNKIVVTNRSDMGIQLTYERQDTFFHDP